MKHPRPDETGSPSDNEAREQDGLYVDIDGWTPDRTVPKPRSERSYSDSDFDLSSLDEKLEKVDKLLAQRYDGVEDLLTPVLIDWVGKDNQKPNSHYDFGPMISAWAYRLIAPSEGYSLVSWEQLEGRLDSNPRLAEKLGFDPDDTPSEKTLRTQWWSRVRPGFRRHLRYEAARKAVRAEDIGLETAENIRENLIEDFLRDDDTDDLDPIGELEQEIKDDAYTFQANLIRDLCEYDRDDSTEYDADLITDATAHMCRLNEYAEQGIDRLVEEYGLDDVFTQQTYRRAVRNVERKKLTHNWDDNDYGADWKPVHELIDPETVDGDLREALEQAWTINPHNPRGETSVWHRRTEEGIEQQIQWLIDEGVIDEDESFDLRIDYTTHDYSRHSSTDSRPPIGVHKQSHFETGYAWKELQATIKINGRAFVIASVNYLPTNTQFQCVRYLIERAQELVNVDTVLADAEFATVNITRYATHRGCDFILRKGATDSVKDTIEEEVESKADWVNNWTMISEGRFDEIDTTLVAVEKNFKSNQNSSASDEGEEDEETEETTLSDFSDDEDEVETDEKQLTIGQAIDEPQEDNEEIDYFCMITNKDIQGTGINPDENPVGHDPEGTVWGIGRHYRDRWGVETAFRDRKEQFQPKTRSRDLGFRRYLWMMSTLIYNGWVMLNTAVADQSPDRDDDEIVVKQNSYLDELDRRVLGTLDVDLEFPGVDYG
ncbi:transposase [Natronolimnohabitans sp. A-GB9]|uniref:transposase n=1 Tax=Natronolimnohabitans sp. A-GB9 TaxID=3069757 RepID=UPI0027B315AB|nr:transposase [Natronolimnohabitans sp. A-GB9]MDQ2050758.1 transposase [Natronolimnohabitans sp. A-GB9]